MSIGTETNNEQKQWCPGTQRTSQRAKVVTIKLVVGRAQHVSPAVDCQDKLIRLGTTS
jgi:hypothetical protein